jgi:predicted nucleic acid-binding protein
MATHLADLSALARAHHRDVAERLGPLLIAGRVATCVATDLEVLRSARSSEEHAELWAERRVLPRVPLTEACSQRAIEVQGLLARAARHRGVSAVDLLVAAAAERDGLTVLHYDHDFDLIAEVTGQPTEWIVPRGTVP